MGGKNPLKVIEEIVKDIGKGVEEAVTGTVKTVGGVAEDIAKDILEAPEKLIKGTAKSAETFAKNAPNVLADTFKLAPQLAKELADSMVVTGKSAIDTIAILAENGSKSFETLAKNIPELGEQFVEGVKDVAKGTEDLLIHGGAEDMLKDFGKSLEEGVRGTIETGGEVVSDLLEPIEENVLKPIEKGISTGAESIDEKVLQPAKEFVEKGGIVGEVADSGFGEDLEEIGKEILNQITPGLVDTKAEKEALKQAQDEQRRLEEQIAEQERERELQGEIAKDRAQLEQGVAQQTTQDTGLGLGQVRAIGGTSMLGEDEDDEILKSLKRFGG